MSLFEWTPDFSVSVQRFDNDHKKLISLVNALNQAMKEGRGRTIVEATLNELLEYTRRHFAGEEEAMRRANYPGLEAHVAEHRALAGQVGKYVAEWKKDASTSPVDLLFFLREWLEKHILHTDRLYGEAMNKAGIY
jgi:hemerythrin